MNTSTNFFSQTLTIKKGIVVALVIILIALIAALVVYLRSRDSFENQFSGYEGYQEDLIEMPLEDAKKMVKYYKETIQIARPDIKLDSLNPPSIHFELGALAKYMVRVAAKKGATGVRVYFARYKKHNLNNTPYEFKDHSTVIFVATKKNADNVNVDILEDSKNAIIQPYNGGISCPPLPASSCSAGELLVTH